MKPTWILCRNYRFRLFSPPHISAASKKISSNGAGACLEKQAKVGVNISFQLHTQRIDPNAQCPICQKNFTRTYSLNRHMLTHTGEKPFVCNTCGAAFNQRTHLKTHQVKNNHLTFAGVDIDGSHGWWWIIFVSIHLLLLSESLQRTLQFEGAYGNAHRGEKFWMRYLWQPFHPEGQPQTALT